MGLLNTGQAVNAEGLQNHALPPHLPPALASAPFHWVRGRGRVHATPTASGRECLACLPACLLGLLPRVTVCSACATPVL